MSSIAFIGDRLSAAGFRLGGAEVHVPEAGDEGPLLAELITRVELVLLTAEIARRIPSQQLHAARMGQTPMVVVIPDVRGQQLPDDPAARLRQQLGMAE